MIWPVPSRSKFRPSYHIAPKSRRKVVRADALNHGRSRSERRAREERFEMRLLIAILLIVYLVGVGVVLAPTIRAKWSSATASDLFGTVMQELPFALTWPAAAYRNITGAPPAPPVTDQPK
jgi:hypothetical protein